MPRVECCSTELGVRKGIQCHEKYLTLLTVCTSSNQHITRAVSLVIVDISFDLRTGFVWAHMGNHVHLPPAQRECFKKVF